MAHSDRKILGLSLNHPVSDTVTVPGDKSISHRSLLFGAIAHGVTEISGFLQAEDCLNTLNMIQQLGVPVEKSGGLLSIAGQGRMGLQAPTGDLYCGNSGTGMRLISGILAAQPFSSRLTGDASLSGRPMGRIMRPLTEMGAHIEATAEQAPLVFKPVDQLKGIHFESQIASAQVKSCLLLAGLYAKGETCVSEPVKSRDHTENMLRGFGYDVHIDGLSVRVQGGGNLVGQSVQVPADISSAAFFMVLAACKENSQLRLPQVCVNPTRAGVIEILQLMGANITLENQQQKAGELLADVCVSYAPLKGIEIPVRLIASAIDEFPIIFIAAALAKGTTILKQADELRHKESDRIAVMISGLKALGIQCEETEDGAIIHGGQFRSGQVDGAGDHRCAMSFLIAGCLTDSEHRIQVSGCGGIATSFPSFIDTCVQLGGQLHV
ncbi:3-phosphoshikimate 1-carboxyvinyltransferase [Marinicella sp. W31]|uniref:3-phosphoshikimate 1-carboxyvinyltransferase n=1 Tax=Marinicella sp. W31 TaxID=3023713 RepID=UPI003757E8F5